VTAMDSVTVRPEQLAAQAASYEAVAQQLGQVAQALRQAVADYAGCWGDDEAGSLFALKYAGPAGDAVQQATGATESVHSLADAVQAWARSYPIADGGS
jgi:uncharacterized protein YukE